MLKDILNKVNYYGYAETKEKYLQALENGDWLMQDMYAALLKNQKELLKEIFAEALDADYFNTVITEKESE